MGNMFSAKVSYLHGMAVGEDGGVYAWQCPRPWKTRGKLPCYPTAEDWRAGVRPCPYLYNYRRQGAEEVHVFCRAVKNYITG